MSPRGGLTRRVRCCTSSTPYTSTRRSSTAGDLVFFGGTVDGEVYVSGVGVVTGRSGTRVDFVVASAREGRVIHTFARTDGDYWRGNIVGAGRFLVRD